MTTAHETLQEQLRVFATDWRADMTAEWVALFGSCEPDEHAINPRLRSSPALPVIPGRLSAPNKSGPPGAHVFRALDGIAPDAVRVVVIGQDPYPDVRKATGRAFEDGAMKDWGGFVAPSLQRLAQSTLASRHERPEFASSEDGWALVQQELRSGAVQLEPLQTLFDRLQTEHGVLFLNAAWTLTRFVPGGCPEQDAHTAFWEPVMTRLIMRLAERDDTPVVFLLFGRTAQVLFSNSGLESAASADGRWGAQVDKVEHPHPHAPKGLYFTKPNPLDRVNSALVRLDASPASW